MKKTISRGLALLLASMLVLSGCGSTGTTNETSNEPNGEGETTGQEQAESTETASSENEIKDLVISQLGVNEMETFNILGSQSQKEFDVLCNAVDGLLEADAHGKLVPGIAKEWGTEDGGLTWTFKLREGVKWVDMNAQEKADCTAQDFATGLEWVLNFHKNNSVNTSMPIEMIEGASEYYEYTKTLTEEEGKALTAGEGSKFLEMVGMEIPDDYTVIYHCTDPKPYFDSVATYACLFPMSQAMVDELGGADGVRAMDNTTMWYNGPYTMTTYVQNNEKVFTKNPTYWDTECKLFDTVTTKMVESNDVAFQLYQSGELDYVDLTESNLKTISGNANNEFYDYLVEKPVDKYSYQIHFNYSKNKEDGTPDTNWNTAIANENFRKAIYYGLDLTDYYKRVNAVNPMNCENNFYTMKGLIYTSDGTDYTELVRQEMGLPENNGETMIRLDAEKAEEYKQAAIEELTALGVTFPVGLDYYIASANQVSLDSANVFKQTVSSSLGDDFIVVNIKTYISSATTEVYTPKLHSISTNGWGADYGDPQNYLGQETYGYDNAYYSTSQSKINDVEETEATKALIDTYKEFTTLVNEANAITDDLDARYQAYAVAEAYMLDHALVIPFYYNPTWCLTKVDPYSKMNAMFGSQNEKMKNWKTNANGFTTEEIKASEEAHNSATNK